MSLDSSDARSTLVRLKLTMPDHERPEDTEKGQQGVTVSTPSRSSVGTQESGGSPQRPSYSPVTPTLSQASLVSQDGPGPELPPPQWMDEAPELLPVSLDDNPDAIALRATLSILQIQRQQALQDMRELDKMKTAALENPGQFVRDLQAGTLSRPPRADDEADELETSMPVEAGTSKFGQFPAAQNIVRTPPIEWAKYHIVGEPLDRIHRTQQQYPSALEQELVSQGRAQPHRIAAPYRPFVDRMEGTKSSPTTKNSNP